MSASSIYISMLLGRLWLQAPDLPNTCPQSCWNSKGPSICSSLASPQVFIQFASLPWVGFFKCFLTYSYAALMPKYSCLFAILLFRFNCWNRYCSEAKITRELLSLTNKNFHNSVQTTLHFIWLKMLLLSPDCNLGTSENLTLHFLLQGIFWTLSFNQNLPGSFVAFHFSPQTTS